MDVKNFFRNILNSSKGINLPQTVTDAFNNQFNNPINTEWVKTEGYYEALFYKNEQEHIARFKPDGKLISLKINLPLDMAPELIRNAAKEQGELMNAIAIQDDNNLKYELIIRDDNLTRYFLLLNSAGEVLEKAKL